MRRGKQVAAIALSMLMVLPSAAGQGAVVFAAEEKNATEGTNTEVVEAADTEKTVDVEEVSEAENEASTTEGITIDETNFPDEVFRDYVKSSFDTDGDGVLSADECNEVTVLWAPEGGITSLKGVEYFANLQKLVCDYNQLTSLDVSKNVKLTSLYCTSNRLTSLDVSRNENLTILNCASNQLTSLDVSKNVNLESLDCNSNQLTSLDVSKSVGLYWLDCYSNQLTSLDVSQNEKLKELNCYGNQLTSLDVSQDVNLVYLECYNNQLTSLDVSQNEKLKELYCFNNQLTSLDVSQDVNLEYLECYNNQLTSLDVSRNVALVGLICWNNQLTSLDVSQDVNLVYLRCWNNQLTSLDVSQDVNLECLECYNNPLTSLDVSSLSRLETLWVSYGYPESVDISQNETLYSFWVAVDDRTQTVDLSRYNGLKTELITDKRWNAESKLVSPSVDDFVWDESDYEILYENTHRYSYKLATSGDEDNCAIYLFQNFYNLIEVNEIKLDKATATLKKGETTTLQATIAPTDATIQELRWTSSNEKVVTVDADGKVTAIAAGTATITCTATDYSGVQASCKIMVTDGSWVFTDVAVNEGNWKYEAVKYVYENGYMTGTSDTTFDPDKPLTRGMVVTVLYRMAGSPDITYTGAYSDVKAGKYYAKAVAWAAKNGIATGYSNGTFGPEKNISRQELAKMICQFAKLQGHETTETTDISGYVDYSKVSGYASKYMQWAVATSLISGKKKSGTYYLDPKGEATRAECAAILQRYEQYYEK